MNQNGDYLIERQKAKKRFRLIPFLVSLFLSFLLWNYVTMVENPDREAVFTGIPVTVVKGENPLSVLTGGNAVIDITVSGKKSLTAKLTDEDFSVIADISDIAAYPTAGEYSAVPLRVEVPAGATLVSQSADNVTLYLDQLSSKSFPVSVEFPGSRTCDDGCELGLDSVELSQSEINVTGPSSVINRIERALLSITIDGRITSTQKFSGTPVLVDKDGNSVSNPYLTMETTTVSGSVPLFMTKEVPLSTEFKYGYLNDRRASVEISPATVRVRGKIETVKNLSDYKLTVIDEKTFSSPFSATIPALEDVYLLDDITEATVTVTTRDITERRFHINTLKADDPSRSDYELDKSSIIVTLMGERSAIADITSDDITATVMLGEINQTSNGALQSAVVSISVSDEFEGRVWEKGEYTVLVNFK